MPSGITVPSGGGTGTTAGRNKYIWCTGHQIRDPLRVSTCFTLLARRHFPCAGSGNWAHSSSDHRWPTSKTPHYISFLCECFGLISCDHRWSTMLGQKSAATATTGYSYVFRRMPGSRDLRQSMSDHQNEPVCKLGVCCGYPNHQRTCEPRPSMVDHAGAHE